MKTARERGWLFNPFGLCPWPILVVGGILAIAFGASAGEVAIVAGGDVVFLRTVRFLRSRKRPNN